MRSKVFQRISATGMAVLMSAFIAVPAAGAVAAQPPKPANPVTEMIIEVAQDCRWMWTDGSLKTARTFRQSRYGTANRLPKIRVTVSPAYPRQKVRLAFYENGRWNRQDLSTTNARGVATVRLNPYTTTGRWANGKWRYRVTVVGAGRYQDLHITYRR
jgi:hypothetical protein